MSDATDLDAVLADLLAPEALEPDPHFAAQTLQLIAAHEALKAQRRRLVRDWLWQMAALAAVLVSLALFSRLPALAALPRQGMLAIASPFTLVVALWLFASGAMDSARLPGRRRPAA